MNKLIGIVIWVVVIGALGGGGYFWYTHASAPAERNYRTAPVKRGQLIASISATGTIEPEEVVDIGAQVAGRINTFGTDKSGKQIDYGSVVEANQVLAQIDASLYQSDLDQAKAQLDIDTAGVTKAQADADTARAKLEQAKSDEEQFKAKVDQAQADLLQLTSKIDQTKSDLAQVQAKFEQAQRDWGRAQKLGPSDALSQESYDAFKGVFEAAQGAVNSSKSMITQAEHNVVSQRAVIAQATANVASQKSIIAQAAAAVVSSTAAIKQAQGTVAHDVAGVARAQQNVDYCTIKSPVKGVIIDRRVNIGQTVVSSLNAPSLFLLAKDLKKMQVWASMNEADIGNIKSGQPVTFTIDAFPGKTFKGTVLKVRLNATMTQNVVTYTIEVETDNSNGTLLPYMTANTQFEVATREDTLMVPNSALRFTPKADEVAPDVAPDEDKTAHEHPKKSDDPAAEKTADGSKPDGGTPEGGRPDGMKRDGTKKDGTRRAGNSNHGKVWIKDGLFLRPIRVRTGITDGTNTEVIVKGDELKEDMQLVVGKLVQSSAEEATNPFAPKLGRPRASTTGASSGSSR